MDSKTFEIPQKISKLNLGILYFESKPCKMLSDFAFSTGISSRFDTIVNCSEQKTFLLHENVYPFFHAGNMWFNPAWNGLKFILYSYFHIKFPSNILQQLQRNFHHIFQCWTNFSKKKVKYMGIGQCWLGIEPYKVTWNLFLEWWLYDNALPPDGNLPREREILLCQAKQVLTDCHNHTCGCLSKLATILYTYFIFWFERQPL